MENDLDKEIEKLKKEIAELESEDIKEKEMINLSEKLKKLKFRKDHKKLLNVTEGLEKGTKRIFKSIGLGIQKGAKALEKSDNYIAEQQKKERELSKNKPKKDSIKNELDFLD